MPEKDKRNRKPKQEHKQDKPDNLINILADIFPGSNPKVNIQVTQDIYHRMENRLKEIHIEPKKVKQGIIFVAAAAATTALVAGGIKYMHDRERKKTEDMKLIELSDKQKEDFTRLTEKHYARIYSFIDFKLAGLTHEAEDLTQKVFERAFNSYGRFVPQQNLDDPFYYWILKIADNLTKNWYRDHSRRQSKTADLESQFDNESSEPQTTIYNTNLTIQQRVEIDEEVRSLYEKVINLKDREKLVVYLTTFENERLTNADLAKILGRSEQAIKNLKNRIKKKLQ